MGVRAGNGSEGIVGLTTATGFIVAGKAVAVVSRDMTRVVAVMATTSLTGDGAGANGDLSAVISEGISAVTTPKAGITSNSAPLDPCVVGNVAALSFV